ncbi:Peptidoglycan-N-acetylglucosamine deacetylase [Pedobacter sp. Bi27]|uniref:polysaccharide deacetylase family protein n=1 Tax=unclassified Pedobacter TaxID=2628915 RepID=UPI001D2C635F|nr:MULTISPECIES: polysaccharide deacetylase family protein [unclassified Pedobacter]CAH0236292.1 Peptidoglycan-N-acetylglucosamine deacetylase [Pedobacter sp. Bi27]CAH0249450.1 Peptidoglycan-N-acetylglucosamine deacetylase [Pedobacter sp. Bi36]CAH0274474.1 Peptidoglycan-N-acetylglucosamine deacetylase [Pedobacter sp. Bi126]
MYLIKSPLLLKWYYPSLLWNKSRTEKVIYLTFDDGPIPNVTDFVLKTLKVFNAKATFFCIGDNIVKHPAVFERVKNDGHAIGNHTFNHLKGWKTDNETYLQNTLKCQELTQTNLFRPPYGRIRKSQIRSLELGVWSSEFKAPSNSQPTTLNSQLQIVMWDVLSGDFDTQLSPEKCYQNVIKHTENGSIIVFHDSLKAFDRLSYALPKVLAYFSEKGFTFSTL